MKLSTSRMRNLTERYSDGSSSEGLKKQENGLRKEPDGSRAEALKTVMIALDMLQLRDEQDNNVAFTKILESLSNRLNEIVAKRTGKEVQGK